MYLQDFLNFCYLNNHLSQYLVSALVMLLNWDNKDPKSHTSVLRKLVKGSLGPRLGGGLKGECPAHHPGQSQEGQEGREGHLPTHNISATLPQWAFCLLPLSSIKAPPLLLAGSACGFVAVQDCNTLPFLNKPVSVGKITDSFFFKVNNSYGSTLAPRNSVTQQKNTGQPRRTPWRPRWIPLRRDVARTSTRWVLHSTQCLKDTPHNHKCDFTQVGTVHQLCMPSPGLHLVPRATHIC